MYKEKKVSAIITARMTSTRLPGKVLLPLAGKPVLQHIIERLRLSDYIDDVVVSTTIHSTDNRIIELCDELGCSYYRGDEHDVLSRTIGCANEHSMEYIVDVTADCPATDYRLVDDLIKNHIDTIISGSGIELTSNVIKRTYPRGLDIQVFHSSLLSKIDDLVDNEVDRQHVTSFAYLNPKGISVFSKLNMNDQDVYLDDDCSKRYSNVRLTLDCQEDYELLCLLFEITNGIPITYGMLKGMISEFPTMFEINSHIEQKNYYVELAKAYSNVQS